MLEANHNEERDRVLSNSFLFERKLFSNLFKEEVVYHVINLVVLEKP